MIVVGCMIGAFALGAVPFALLLGKLLGVDIRQVGSRNTGATNLARARGVRWGVLAFVLDAAKGALPVAGAQWSSVFSEHREWLPVAAGGVAILGHCFSPYLKFKGGKGVATAAGVLAILSPFLFGGLLLLWGLLLWVSRNVGLASSVAAFAAGSMGIVEFFRGRPYFGGFLLVLAVLVIVRHRKNLRGLLRRQTIGPVT